MSKLIKKNYTEKQIQKLLIKEYACYFSRRKHKIAALNIYLFYWESDFLTINKNDYVYEFEIKCSKWDYLNDFKKENKHESFNSLKSNNIPNYFYYVAPEGMIKLEDIPEYAGLIEIDKYERLIFRKKAPILHKEKFDRYEEIAIKLMYKLI